MNYCRNGAYQSGKMSTINSVELWKEKLYWIWIYSSRDFTAKRDLFSFAISKIFCLRLMVEYIKINHFSLKSRRKNKFEWNGEKFIAFISFCLGVFSLHWLCDKEENKKGGGEKKKIIKTMKINYGDNWAQKTMSKGSGEYHYDTIGPGPCVAKHVQSLSIFCCCNLLSNAPWLFIKNFIRSLSRLIDMWNSGKRRFLRQSPRITSTWIGRVECWANNLFMWDKARNLRYWTGYGNFKILLILTSNKLLAVLWRKFWMKNE